MESLRNRTEPSQNAKLAPPGWKLDGVEGKALKQAYKEVEDQEDEHYYHSKGWLRELSLESLGLKKLSLDTRHVEPR